MARRGGYSKSTNDEWMKTSQQRYAEAITSAAKMQQDPVIWLSDAIAHHAYRCEMILGKERYANACKNAADRMEVSPLEADYMPKEPPPTITRPAGQGSGPTGRSYTR